MDWTERLIAWYEENKRALPWRESKDPYRVWLSEIILQQTRVEQGLSYYVDFLERFPTIQDLAAADETQVLKAWQGLGYYSRARNLHHTAKYVCEHYAGHFPTTFEALKELKGIGDYTASAIASICFYVPEPVIDGNVYRFFSRYFGIHTPIGTASALKVYKKKGYEFISHSKPDTFNQAIMEFGARQCKPQNPNCENCIFNSSCYAFLNEKVNALPIKINRTKIKNRYLNYVVVQTPSSKTILEQRKEKGIWHKLYQFPVIEFSQKRVSKHAIETHEHFQALISSSAYSLKRWNKNPILHKLSHQHLYIRFWILSTEKEIPDAIAIQTLLKLPVPIVLEKFIEDFFCSLK